MDEFFAKGKRGHLFLREEGGRRVLVKRRNPASAVDTIANEARFTALLNGHGIGPAFLSYGQGELVREFVEGEEFRRWLPGATKESLRRLLLAILDQCRTLDRLGINKQEMTRPWKHIIIKKDGEPVLIDFERCTETERPKNVTQFCHFLAGTRMGRRCAELGLAIDRAALLRLAQAYKRGGEQEKSYKALRSLVADG